MRRQGQYADSTANAYIGTQMPHMSGQTVEHRSDTFQERLEAFTPERDHPYATSKVEDQWRWEREESRVSNAMASQIYNEGTVMNQGVDVPRNYFMGKRLEPNPALDKRGSNDPTHQPREEDTHVSFGNNSLSQSFEGLEQKFFDDILKLSKEQNDAEDAENARHREKINAINEQYQEQLAALRARHASRRAEFLHKESHARQMKYQQATMDHHSNTGRVPDDHHGYSGVAASVVAVNEAHQTYNSGHYEPHRERTQFLPGSRDRGFESRGPYPRGRMYDSSSHYY